jgi:hypothetical protein
MARKPAKEKNVAAAAQPADPGRVLGVLLGWTVGAVVGWQHAAQSDLFDGVVRGAMAFAGVTVVWMIGAGLCDWIVAQAPQQKSEVNESAGKPAEEGTAVHA